MYRGIYVSFKMNFLAFKFYIKLQLCQIFKKIKYISAKNYKP